MLVCVLLLLLAVVPSSQQIQQRLSDRELFGEDEFLDPSDGGLGDLKRKEEQQKKEKEKQQNQPPEVKIKPPDDHNDESGVLIYGERMCPTSIPYLTHFTRRLLEEIDSNEVNTLNFYLPEPRKERLQKLLKEEKKNEKEILDTLLECLEVPQTSQLTPPLRKFLTSGLQNAFLACLACIAFYRVTGWGYYTWRAVIGWIVLFSFVISIPWEWYRLYKEALSKKASNILKDIPVECTNENPGLAKSFLVWYRSQFSTEEDICDKYYKDLHVDPFLDASPLMAVSVAISRMFGEPLKILAGTCGECFKLFFREIPLQWQLPVAVATFVIIVIFVFSVFGLQVRTPLLAIGVNNADRVVNRFEHLEPPRQVAIEDEHRRPAVENIPPVVTPSPCRVTENRVAPIKDDRALSQMEDLAERLGDVTDGNQARANNEPPRNSGVSRSSVHNSTGGDSGNRPHTDAVNPSSSGPSTNSSVESNAHQTNLNVESNARQTNSNVKSNARQTVLPQGSPVMQERHFSERQSRLEENIGDNRAPVESMDDTVVVTPEMIQDIPSMSAGGGPVESEWHDE